MCGIAGLFSQTVICKSVIEKTKESLFSRGPDVQSHTSWNAKGERCDTHATSALIHTRLSIRDLDARANQPMSDSSGQVWICYNGEVYDWEEEKKNLQAEGYVFNTTSDTEFILNGYLKYGKDILQKLRGMFAFAILDLRVNKLLLARDRMGQKPLYYSIFNGSLAFGSTFRSVWTLMDKQPKSLNKHAIDAYLAHRYIPAPHTLSQEINKLENGYCIEWDLASKTFSKELYWNPQQKSNAGWNQNLLESVDIRTASDRPVGVFLSGGVDSTAIASILSQKGHKDITAFTASFGDSRFDESEVAKQTAKELGLPLKEIKIPLDISLELFDQIIDDIDEPFADPSSFPTWLLCKETSRHVVLGGDGGDELFAGYKRYKKHLNSAWRGNLSIPGSPFKVKDSKNGKILSELRMSWHDAYSLRFSGFTPHQRESLLPNLNSKKTNYWRESQFSSAHDDSINQLLATDYSNYLPEYILKKGDLCSMAHGLELRCPFMDHELFASLQQLPKEQRFTSPAKQVLSKVSPQVECVLKLKKKGFNPPLTHWLRESWKDRYPGLGFRLAKNSNGLIDAYNTDALISNYLKGKEILAERVLQLLILDRILSQYSC